jgi:hypothetical protein
MLKLGYTFDVGLDGYDAALASAGFTGIRQNVTDCQNINFVTFVGAAGSGSEDLVFTLSQHNAASSGTTKALVVDHVWVKAATTMDGTETWTKVANAATDGTFTLAGATYADHQCIVVFEVNTKDLYDTTYNWVSLSIADPGSGTRAGVVLAIPADLQVRRSPDQLLALHR